MLYLQTTDSMTDNEEIISNVINKIMLKAMLVNDCLL